MKRLNRPINGKKFQGPSSNAIKKKKHTTNPFEVHINRSKFKVIGKISKDDRGLPGVSRSKAIKTRERTLLQEYKNRYKSNKFIDQRIGEHNPFLDPDQKIALRMIAETKQQFSKKSNFNLNDEESTLMHGGKSLTEANINDTRAFSDDEDDEDMHDADFVKSHHFGGDFLTKSSDNKTDNDNNQINKKDRILEMIAESKMKRAESKQKKEDQEESVLNMDKKYKDFRSSLIKSGSLMTDDHKDQSKKEDLYKKYNCSVNAWAFDRSKRSIPSDKLRTADEIAKEERAKLDALESDRKRRMRSDAEDSKALYQPSADALDDGFDFNSSSKLMVSYKDGALLGQNMETEPIEEQETIQNLKASLGSSKLFLPADKKISSDEEEELDDDNSEEDDDDDDSDQYSDILEEEEVDEKSENEDDCEISKSKKSSIVKLSSEKKALPFTFEVPSEYESFWNLLQGHTPADVSTIVERMISCQHPSLGHKNKNKCTIIFSYLLQTLHTVCSLCPETILEGESSLSYIDSLIPHLYVITQLAPSECASSLSDVLDEKYAEYNKQHPKKFPYLDTFIFLKLSGLLFPASDFHHDVMTRVITFIAQILGEARVNTSREVSCLLFSSSLLYEYLSRSCRFIGELSNALRGIFYLSIPTDVSKLKLPHTAPFSRVGPKADILVLRNSIKSLESSKFTLASLNKETIITEEFKVRAFNHSLEIFKKLSTTWETLPSVRAIFSLTIPLLEKVTMENYPTETLSLLNDLKTCISNLPKQLVPLAREHTIKTLKMVEPMSEVIFDGPRRRKEDTRESIEIQKLRQRIKREKKSTVREIKRDTSFLAKVKLQETIQSDVERKRKVNIIMKGLSSQESEFKRFKDNLRH